MPREVGSRTKKEVVIKYNFLKNFILFWAFISWQRTNSSNLFSISNCSQISQCSNWVEARCCRSINWRLLKVLYYCRQLVGLCLGLIEIFPLIIKVILFVTKGFLLVTKGFPLVTKDQGSTHPFTFFWSEVWQRTKNELTNLRTGRNHEPCLLLV